MSQKGRKPFLAFTPDHPKDLEPIKVAVKPIRMLNAGYPDPELAGHWGGKGWTGDEDGIREQRQRIV